jgi:hypothetical protein
LAKAFSVALIGAAFAVGLAGCAGRSGGGSFKQVEFRAPALPDPELSPLLEGVETIGVLSGTTIEAVRGVDIEKVMGRLTDATSKSLGRNLPESSVITQDEIRWHFKEVFFDSTWLAAEENRTALRDELEIDAVIYVVLEGFQAQMTPVSPSPYGMVHTPGMNISVDLELSLLNLRTGRSWTQQRQRSSNWQPMQVNLLGGGDGGERQLLSALARPLRQFLVRVAPPPTLEGRHFDLSGE